MGSCTVSQKEVRAAANKFPGNAVIVSLDRHMFAESLRNLPDGCGHDHSLLVAHNMLTMGMNLIANAMYQYSVAVNEDHDKREAMQDAMLASLTQILAEVEPMDDEVKLMAFLDKFQAPLVTAQKHMLNSYLGGDISLN